MSITEADRPRTLAFLDPRGDAEVREGGANPRLPSLDGKTIGILIDGPWRSWYVFSEVLQQRIKGRNIDAKRLSVNHLDFNSHGLDLDSIIVGSRHDNAVEQFAAEIDAVVVGLGN